MPDDHCAPLLHVIELQNVLPLPASFQPAQDPNIWRIHRFLHPDMPNTTKIFTRPTFVQKMAPQGIRYMHKRNIAHRCGVTLSIEYISSLMICSDYTVNNMMFSVSGMYLIGFHPTKKSTVMRTSRVLRRLIPGHSVERR